MMDNVEAKVKELVTDFKLEEALDVLIAQAQTQNQRKQNALLVLKGKLALLEEQSLSGMLDPNDLARQKATIAHQILDIADGSPLDREQSQDSIQKTSSMTANENSFGKYLLWGALLVAAVLLGIFIAKCGGERTESTNKNHVEHPTEGGAVENAQPNTATGEEIKVDFPNYRKKFNFLDFQYEFTEVTASQYSDTEVQLMLKYVLTCRNNAGSCFRSIARIYADGNPIGPTYQKDLLGYYASQTTITDELTFVLPANAKEYMIELSRDGSTWKRPIKFFAN